MTSMTLDIAGDEPGASRIVVVREPFDRVLDLVVPLSGLSSGLEARERLVLTSTDGRRVLVRPEHVVLVEEDAVDA